MFILCGAVFVCFSISIWFDYRKAKKEIMNTSKMKIISGWGVMLSLIVSCCAVFIISIYMDCVEYGYTFSRTMQNFLKEGWWICAILTLIPWSILAIFYGYILEKFLNNCLSLLYIRQSSCIQKTADRIIKIKEILKKIRVIRIKGKTETWAEVSADNLRLEYDIKGGWRVCCYLHAASEDFWKDNYNEYISINGTTELEQELDSQMHIEVLGKYEDEFCYAHLTTSLYFDKNIAKEVFFRELKKMLLQRGVEVKHERRYSIDWFYI